MRKFIVYTRPIPGQSGTDLPAVVEVEGEVVPQTEDPSLGWLPEGEFKFRITQPEFLYEPQEKKTTSKDKVMVPPVYYSHAVYYNIYQAYVAAEQMVRESFAFAKRKDGIDFTEEEVRSKFAEIQQVLLDI